MGLLLPLAILDRRMQAAGGTGIIPFELAGPELSIKTLRKWGPEGRRAARASLLLDFPFLLAYSTLNVRLTRRASGPPAHGVLGDIGRLVVAMQVAAGMCDAVENAALLGVLARDGDARLASLARGAARAKFAGLIVGGLYGAAAAVLTARRQP